MKLQAGPRITTERRITVAVQRLPWWFPDETQVCVNQKDIEKHDGGAERPPPCEDVEVLPGPSVFAFDKFLDYFRHFAPISAEVVAQVLGDPLRPHREEDVQRRRH